MGNPTHLHTLIFNSESCTGGQI